MILDQADAIIPRVYTQLHPTATKNTLLAAQRIAVVNFVVDEGTTYFEQRYG